MTVWDIIKSKVLCASTGSYMYFTSHTNLVVVWFVGEELRTHVVRCPYQCGGHVTGRLQDSTNKDTQIHQ